MSRLHYSARAVSLLCWNHSVNNGLPLVNTAHHVTSLNPAGFRLSSRFISTVDERRASSTSSASRPPTGNDVTGDPASVDLSASSYSSRPELGGFARSFAKFDEALNPEPPVEPTEPSKPFLTMLRESQFIRLGAIKDSIVEGRIFHTVGDDLYIDFGGKFHCVCQRPPARGERFMRGAVVRIKLRDLELSSLFIGAKTDLSLLEADAVIVGLVSTPYNSES